MNKYNNIKGYLPKRHGRLIAVSLGVTLFVGLPAIAADPVKTSGRKAVALNKSTRAIPTSTEIVPRMEFSPGQSHIIRLPVGVSLQKVKVEDDKIVQVEVTSPREIVLHAKTVGSTSLMIWDKSGQVTIMDVGVVGTTIGMDAVALQGKLQQMLPSEKGIIVGTAAGSLVLSGTATDAIKVDKAVELAEAFVEKSAGKKVINMLQVAAPQQVMLEVKMAEVSKNLLDKLGAQFGASRVNGGVAYAIATGFLSLGTGNITLKKGNTSIKIDAEDKDSVVKILAEPNIIAISGQEGSFLAGGKFYITVPQALGVSTLEEKDFGVGLKFTPTVLEDGLINLRVAPEVTELGKVEDTAGTTISSLITRRVSTTVQLHDGQSFAIAGLIKNNTSSSIRRFPLLGNIPVIGALFRSSSFQNEKTELLFVVTPRLVKPLPADYGLPTDNYKSPDKQEFFLEGKLEGKPAEATVNQSASKIKQPSNDVQEPKSLQDGFEMK
jgi:pilus assembly protein CpaC